MKSELAEYLKNCLKIMKAKFLQKKILLLPRKLFRNQQYGSY